MRSRARWAVPGNANEFRATEADRWFLQRNPRELWEAMDVFAVLVVLQVCM